jgi:hypothetical protein
MMMPQKLKTLSIVTSLLLQCACSTAMGATQTAGAAAQAPVEKVEAVAVQLGAGRVNRRFPNELDDRLYLRRVPIDPRGLTRVAGAVLNFYGHVHADGTCTPDTGRAPSLEPQRFIRDSVTMTTDLLSIVKYQSILDRTAAAGASLIVADLALRDSQLAEVIVEDIAKIEALEVLNLSALDSLRREELPPGICSRAVVAAAYLTSIKSRVYRQAAGQAVVTGLGFGLDGKFFVSNSDFGSNLLLSVDARLIRERPTPSGLTARADGLMRGSFPAPIAFADYSPEAHASLTVHSESHLNPD